MRRKKDKNIKTLRRNRGKQKTPSIICLLLFLTFALCGCQHTTPQVDGLPYQISKEGRWGIISVEGKLLTDTIFLAQPSAVVNGRFTVSDSTGQLQLFDISRLEKPLSANTYYRIGHFFAPVTWAQSTPGSTPLLIDKQGCIIPSQHTHYDIARVHNFREGRALIVTQQGKYGYLNEKGQMTILPIYDYAADFHEGKAVVGLKDEKGQMGFLVIDRQGHICFSIQLSNSQIGSHISQGRLIFKEEKSGRYGYMDEQGTPLFYLPDGTTHANSFLHGVARIKNDTGYGLISSDGELLIPCLYDSLIIASKKHIWLLQQGKWNLADLQGTPLLTQETTGVTPFFNGKTALVQQKDETSFINLQGKIVQRYEGMTIQPFNPHSVEVFTINKPPTTKSEEANDQLGLRSESSDKGTIAHQSLTIHTTDWRKVAENHPFYTEARKVISGNLTEDDAGYRELILNYVEHLRTSYTTKDIDFLEQLFSEKALIIVGSVIRQASTPESNYLTPAQVVYNVRTKREYLTRLKQVFATNRSIDLHFSDFRIMRHPTREGFYGVSLRQGYKSNQYSDDGYLFLLWDFTDPYAPQIHVRTWQPAWIDNDTPLPVDEVYDLSNFNLE